MKVVFMGTPDFAAGTLAALADAGCQVTGVVTQPDKPRGRRKEITPGPVRAEAEKRGFLVYQPKKVRDPEALEVIRRMEPDLIVVAAFGQILPKELLDLPRYGCINVHASLLPAYRGAAPIQHAILDGLIETGVTIMRMDEGLDTGDMIAWETCPIREDETGGSLFDRLAELGAELLVRTIPTLVDGTAVYTPQPKDSTTSYAAMIKKEDGKVDWTRTAREIERQVRAFNPWPSAYTTLDGKILKIWQAHIEDLPEGGKAPAGTILKRENGRLWVQTGEGVLALDQVQLAGKKRMAAGDFLRGCRIQNGALPS